MVTVPLHPSLWPRRVPLSASYVGKLVMNNGNKVRIWAHTNANTGQPVVYQRVAWADGTFGKVVSTVGRNRIKMIQSLNETLNEGQASWEGERNDAVLDMWYKECLA